MDKNKFASYINNNPHTEYHQVPTIFHPFNPGVVTLELIYHPGTMKHQLSVELENWPSMGNTFDITRLHLDAYPEDSYLAVNNMIRNYYRNLKRITPEPNIVLGEN